MEINLLRFDDLTDLEKEDQPNNGYGKEDASYLKVTHNNKVVILESDAMEPEDCTFGRDLKWIRKALMKCYELNNSITD